MKTRTNTNLLAMYTAATALSTPLIALAQHGEDFDEPSPFTWLGTQFRLIIPNGHQLIREDPTSDSCLPLPDLAGRFHIARTDSDREGICSSTSSSPACDAFALRRDVPANHLLDTHMRSYIAATGLMGGQQQRVGLVARAHVAEVAGVPQISGGYAAIMQVFSGTTYPIQAVVEIVRLDGPCITSGTLLVYSTAFEVQCNRNYKLKFTVAGNSLRASIDEFHVGAGGTVVKSALVLNGSTNQNELEVLDGTYASPGLNGVVGYAPSPGHVYWDDVRTFNLTPVSFENAASGSVIGGQANQAPGTVAYSESGVDFRTARVTPPGAGAQPIYGFGQFVITPTSLGGGQGLRLSDMAIQPEISGTSLSDLAILRGRLSGATPQDRWINVALNGQPPYIGALTGFDQNNFDIDPFSLPFAGGGHQYGIEIDGTLSALTFGGHDAVIDSFLSGSLVYDEATAPTCYANCDGSTTTPVLTANDFQCFLNAFAAGSSYANCDGSTTTPVLTANDFQCFLNAFAAGCP